MFTEMNKLSGARKHLHILLKIKQQASTDRQIGRCLDKINKLPDAKETSEAALKYKQGLARELVPDNRVATATNEVLSCFLEKNDTFGCKKHLERELKIEQQISSNLAPDNSVTIA